MNENCETLSKKQKISLFTKFKNIVKFKKVYKTISIVLPKGFMNCRISICNNFFADTNDSFNWDTLSFPLPEPKYKWNIKGYKGNADKPQKQTVILIDCP
jgi:hypothetical protein